MSTSRQFVTSARGSALVVLFLGLLLYVPSFATDELDDEEGRRAIPAREMLASGDYVLPTIWGQPYLNKPPMFFWLVAGSSKLVGGVNEAATRLPSVIATLVTALAVLAVGRRIAGPRTALISAVLVLVTFGIIEKGAFGELEAVLTASVFVASAALWQASADPSRRARWTALAGVALGAALLTKGPPAYVFFFASAIAVAVEQRDVRRLFSAPVWISAAVGTGLLLAWVVPLVGRPELEGVFAKWGGEMAREDGGAGEYLAARGDFLLGVLVAFFPASFVWLLSLGTPTRSRLQRDAAYRVPALTVLLGLTFFALMPGTAVRYVHPLLPWAALAGGSLVAGGLGGGDASLERRLRGLGRFVALLGLAIGAGAAWLLVGSISDIEGLGPIGVTLGLAALLASLVAWKAWTAGPRPAALWLTFAILACARLLQIAEVVPQTADRRGRVVAAQTLDAHLPPGEPVQLAVGYHYNTLFYVQRPLVRIDDPLAAPVGAPVLLDARQLTALREEGGFEAEVLVEVPTHEGPTLALVRRTD